MMFIWVQLNPTDCRISLQTQQLFHRFLQRGALQFRLCYPGGFENPGQNYPYGEKGKPCRQSGFPLCRIALYLLPVQEAGVYFLIQVGIRGPNA